MSFHRKICLCALLLTILASGRLAADDRLPSLAADSNITSGRLDNGITYYLATNSGQKGLVDMALVQKAGRADEGDRRGESTVFSRGVLAELPRFSDPAPFGFLQGMGVFPSERGYVYVSDDATVYSFPNFMVSQTTEAVDSTLLMLFDIIESQSSTSPRYAPANQAIIIAGDIDASSLVTKMNMLSMLVSRRTAEDRPKNYKWTSSDTLRFRFGRSHEGAACSLTFRYSVQRMPQESMGSVQELVTKRLMREVGVLVRKRLSAEFRERGIPYSDLRCVYRNGAEGPSDESFSVSLNVEKDLVAEAAAAVGGVFSAIDAGGVATDEYKDIKSEAGMDWYYVQTELSNAYYVNRCTSAFLYGSSLASPQTEKEFYTGRDVSDETGARLLSSFAAALLDKERNLAIECRAPRNDSLRIALTQAFSSAWTVTASAPRVFGADTLALNAHKKAVKLKSEVSEPMTGGKLWTFSNGMQVVFKQADDDGVFCYDFLLRSGYAKAKGLNPGEFAYLGDVIGVCDIGGIPGEDFREILLANGVEVNTKIDVSDVNISGRAPSSKAMLVLKALLAIAYDSKPNAAAFDYYRRCELLSDDMDEERLSRRETIIDSLLAPGYEYIPSKKGNELPDDFPSRADDFFDAVFSKANDGVLILVGDLDETVLKKLLCQYLGAFKTDSSSSFRARTSYLAPTGVRSKRVKGGRSLMDLAYSLPFNYTAENFMAANVASIAIYRAVGSAAASAGWHSSWSNEFVMFPDERVNIRFHLGMCDKNGLPASMIQGSSVQEVARRVDGAVGLLSRKGINSQQLDTYISQYGNTLKASMSQSQTIVDMLVLRYSYGKDLMTNYEDRLKAVKLERVNELLSQLEGCSVARYMVDGPAEEEVIYEPQIDEPAYTMPDSLCIGAGEDPTGMAKLYWRLFHGMYEDEPDERIDVTKLWNPEPLPEPKPEPLSEQEEEPSATESSLEPDPSPQGEDEFGSYDEAGLDKIEGAEDVVDDPEEETDDVSRDENEDIESSENL